MDNGLFEGYIGLRLADGSYLNDVIPVILLIEISLFAAVFHSHAFLLRKMAKDLLSVKERDNLFDRPVKSDLFFRGFMKLQMLSLCALFFYLLAGHYYPMPTDDLRSVLLPLGLIFAAVGLYYLLKRIIYFLYGHAFDAGERYAMWDNRYQALTGIWGCTLYVPILWLFFDNRYPHYVAAAFLLLYALYRILLIYITIRIFYNRRTGILFLCSYLCAQEIIPLFLAYEGVRYTLQLTDISSLWH